MDNLVCLKDFEAAALQKLEPSTADYYRGGADDEVTAEDNKDAYNK
jgi:isopentenyl diphosphate isomerase/L-lactate dehydrogenase-like FMN-dependent dehydrogenase